MAKYIVILITCLFPFLISAEQPVEMQIVTDVVEGAGNVGLLLVAHQPVKDARLVIGGPHGERTVRSGFIAAGSQKLLAIPQKVGTVTYDGRLDVEFEDGQTGSAPVKFSLSVLEGMRLSVTENELDLEKKRLTVRASREIQRVEYTVISDTGAVLDEGSSTDVTVDDPKAIRVTWAGKEGAIIRIDLTAFDAKNTFSKLELSPWFVDVEHEEVNFPSGSHVILPKEAPKLDRAYAHLQEKVNKYGNLVSLNLYVVGYTDTVGKPDHNLELSKRRARSIAAYMKKQGFKFPVYYQGFGEEVLAVPTEDETDEAKNRRALYLLGGDFKPTGPQIPRTDWKRLD